MSQPAASGAVSSGELRAVAASLGQAPAPVASAPAVPAPPAFAADTVSTPRLPKVKLGEELPIFCERCGYALHGLPQNRCGRCEILHFSCPECGHHQPINTLRPAAQRVLGRVRGFFLGCWVFFKLNFFGWLLFAWFAMGVEWSYNFQPIRGNTNVPNAWTYQVVPRPVDIEAGTAFCIFALSFGMVSRMLMLRWRRGWAVGAVLAGLVMLAVHLGAWFRSTVDYAGRGAIVLPMGIDFHMLIVATGLTLVFAAMVVWPTWLALVHLFLPARTASALLDWQRSIPDAPGVLAREV